MTQCIPLHRRRAHIPHRLVCLPFALMLLGCAHRQTPLAIDAENVVPKNHRIRPWALAGEPVVYAPDALNELLGDQADVYRNHGTRRAIHAEYRHRADSTVRLALDLFETSDPNAANALLTAARTDSAEPFDLGTDAYWQHGQLHWTQGHFYARVTAPDNTLRAFTGASLVAVVTDELLTRATSKQSR